MLMGANRAALIETTNQRHQDELLTSNRRATLRLAKPEDNPGSRLRRVVDLASTLMKEAQVLACDQTLADASSRLQNIDVAKGVDFYAEVERFEAALIKMALEQADGNQAKAARLLGLRATTLNSKIKLLFS
jgi:transcriptional regulator with PAS, ATPase and Fis domain